MATLAVTLVLPAVVAGLLAGSTAVLVVVLGEAAAVAGATRCGWARMARVVPVMAVVTAVAVMVLAMLRIDPNPARSPVQFRGWLAETARRVLLAGAANLNATRH